MLRTRLLMLIAGLLVVAGLRWSYPVGMPLAVAVFIVAATWPVKVWLDRLLPPFLSYLCTVLLLLAVFAAFALALYVSIAQLVGTLIEREEQFAGLYARYQTWAAAQGLPLLDLRDSYGRLLAAAQTVLAQTYTIVAYLGLIAVLVLFGLPEVPEFSRRIRQDADAGEQDAIFGTAAEISAKIRSYIGVTMITSLLTGFASAGWAFAMGLDLAVLWGILNFLLNFVPVIGNIIGIIPPTLYALLQFGDWGTTALVFAGYVVLQLTISNLVYPWLQGRGLSLSPAAIVFSLFFWGWLWGAAGALMAVPLTAALVIVCGHFRQTAWIERLLTRG